MTSETEMSDYSHPDFAFSELSTSSRLLSGLSLIAYYQAGNDTLEKSAFGVKVNSGNYFEDYIHLVDGYVYTRAIDDPELPSEVFSGSTSGVTNNLNVAGATTDTINIYPFLYKYSLGGSLINNPEIESGSVAQDTGVSATFKPIVINGTAGETITKDGALTISGIDQYGVKYADSNYSFELRPGSSETGYLSGVTYTNNKLVIDNDKLNQSETNFSIVIKADSQNRYDATTGNYDKRTEIVIPITVIKDYPEYTFTLDPNGGAFASTPEGFTENSGKYIATIYSENNYTYGDFISNVKAPTKDGVVFLGWQEGSNDVYEEDNLDSNANHTLKALWSTPDEQYTVKYYEKTGGTEAFITKTVLKDDPIFTDDLYEEWDKIYDQNEHKGEYRFAGWSLNGNTVTSAQANAISDANGDKTIEVYAVYEKEYTVKFHINGGSSSSAQNDVITIYVTDSELENSLYADYSYSKTCPSGTYFVDYYGTELNVKAPELFHSLSGTKNSDVNLFWAIPGSKGLSYREESPINGVKVYDATVENSIVLLSEDYTTKVDVDATAALKAELVAEGYDGSLDSVVVYSQDSAGSNFNQIVESGEYGKTYDVYAAWTPNTFTVNFNGNGNTSGSMDEIKISNKIVYLNEICVFSFSKLCINTSSNINNTFIY